MDKYVNERLFNQVFNESYEDDYQAWKSADDNYKASEKAAQKDQRDIRKKHRWSREYLNDADDYIKAGQQQSDEYRNAMKDWLDGADSIPQLFTALIKCLLVSAPYLACKFITGAIKLSEIPAALDDKRARMLVGEIQRKLDEEGLNVRDLHKKMVNTYNAENVELEAGKKARCNNKVVTLIKPMSGDRWQVQFSDGHKETVLESEITPYKTELAAIKERYGEN
jgi:hypothetical protein